MIRSLLTPEKYVMVVEHDLSILDYLSDYICCLYGVPGVYGVVTMPFSVREGINIFLGGFIPTENMRFREEELTFKTTADSSADDDNAVGPDGKPKKIMKAYMTEYPAMYKKMGDFSIDIKGGTYSPSEIVVMLGQNGTGKTTLIKMLAGVIKPDSVEGGGEMPKLNISYKP